MSNTSALEMYTANVGVENTIDERASKRRLKTEPVDQESLRQSQTLSTGHPSSTEDIPRQVDSINRARALPTITSLQPGLSSVQPHKNLPSPASTQITTQTAHLTEHNVLRASPVGPAPQPSCHQAQQSESWHLRGNSLAYDCDRFYPADGGGATAVGTTSAATAGRTAAQTAAAAGLH